MPAATTPVTTQLMRLFGSMNASGLLSRNIVVAVGTARCAFSSSEGPPTFSEAGLLLPGVQRRRPWFRVADRARNAAPALWPPMRESSMHELQAVAQLLLRVKGGKDHGPERLVDPREVRGALIHSGERPARRQSMSKREHRETSK